MNSYNYTPDIEALTLVLGAPACPLSPINVQAFFVREQALNTDIAWTTKLTIWCPSSFYLFNFKHDKIQHQSIPQQEIGHMWTAEQRLKRIFSQGNERHNVRPNLLRNKIWRKSEGKCFTKKVMNVSSHVQEHRRDSVLPIHSQQSFHLRTEASSFRNVCLFWILVARENVLMSAGDISQRKTSLIFAIFVL